MNKEKVVPQGISSFRKIIGNNLYYVDKTNLIKDILKKEAEVILFPRPRRFGKSLNLSMLDEFFNIEKSSNELFKGLNIYSDKKSMELINTYPVIKISLKACKANNWLEEYEMLKEVIANVYTKNQYNVVFEYMYEEQIFNNIINRMGNEIDYKLSLSNLSKFVSRYYKKEVIILIDEYDAMIENSYLYNFYDEAINFMRTFLSEALKDNECLKFSCLTGILRIAKESIFSGMNNVCIYSILESEYNEYFGFTEKEVNEMLEYFNIEDRISIKDWYNGYNFSGLKIYNPWSVLTCVSKKGKVGAYWTNTGGVGLLEDLIGKCSDGIKDDLEKLLKSKVVEVEKNDSIVYKNLKNSRIDILNFLLLCGYLTLDNKVVLEDKEILTLKIPNKEIKLQYPSIVENWFFQNDKTNLIRLLQRSIIKNEKEYVEDYLNEILINCISFFDSSENFYHGLFLGLMVGLQDKFEVTSNKESGYGRYDLMIKALDKSLGIIIEFKVLKSKSSKSLEELASIGLKQIEENKYYKSLEISGIKNIYKYSIAFDSKKAVVM